MAESTPADSAGANLTRWQRVLTVAVALAGVTAMFAVLAKVREADGPATIAELAESDERATEPFGDFSTVSFTLDSEPFCADYLVADTAAERAKGLSTVAAIEPYAGMLFVFEGDTDVAFTMRDTRIPLTIAWYAADGRLVDLQNMAVPANDAQAASLYRSSGRYRYAVEVPQGSELPNLLETC
jgi:uncharacterized membrane protein (UPF0127 family)